MNKNIKLLTLFNFFTDFVFFAPVAIIYFSQTTKSFALGMSIFSIAYVSSALFEIPTGVISDYIGRKKTMTAGSFFGALCIIFYAYGGSYWVMALGGVFQGLSRSFYSGNNNAFLHDTLKALDKESEYHTYLGKTSSMFQIALALASLIGGFLATISLPLVVWISVLPQLCCFIISFFFEEPDIGNKESSNLYIHLQNSLLEFKQNYKLKLLTITSSLRFAIGESSYFLESAFVNSLWPIWGVGVFGTLQHVFGATGYYFSGKIINKLSSLKVLIFENIINRVLGIFALIFPTLTSPLIIASTSLPWGAGSVAENSLLQKEFTEKQRATMGSLNSLIGNIAFGIFSILFGWLGDTFGVRQSLLIATLILIFPIFIYRKIFIEESVKEKRE